jgi:NitT/TauT family transport system permease protein
MEATTTNVSPSSAPRPHRPPIATELLVAATVRAESRRQAWTTVGVYCTRLAIIAGPLVVWQLAATHWFDSFSYSTPIQVWRRLDEWFAEGTAFGPIWIQIATTLQEALVGFTIGTTAAMTAGVLLGRRRFLARVLSPLVRIANAVPRIVLASLFYILFGLGVSSKIATVVVMVFFAVFFETFHSIRDIDEKPLQEARVIGATPRQELAHIILPAAAGRILRSLHTAFGLALIGAIVSEYIGADRGLGLLIYNAQATFDVAGIYAGMIITTVIALVADWALIVLEGRLKRVWFL